MFLFLFLLRITIQAVTVQKAVDQALNDTERYLVWDLEDIVFRRGTSALDCSTSVDHCTLQLLLGITTILDPKLIGTLIFDVIQRPAYQCPPGRFVGTVTYPIVGTIDLSLGQTAWTSSSYPDLDNDNYCVYWHQYTPDYQLYYFIITATKNMDQLGLSVTVIIGIVFGCISFCLTLFVFVYKSNWIV